MTTFTELKLSAPLLQALATEGYETPTPIQAQAIPALLEGRDLLGIAQTGTGKTAAFALPLLQRLTSTDRRAGPRSIRVLILTPTRELCIQILNSFRTYGRHLRLSRAAIYGGVSQGPQVQNLARGLDVLVATPGRLLDLMNQGQVRFDSLEAFVLDEADRMLDMGFIVPVKRIVAKLPKERQTLLFSATMPQAVHGLVASLLKDPVRVEVTPTATTAERISQRVHFVEKANKRALLQHLLATRRSRGRWSSPAPSMAPTRWPSSWAARRARRRHPRQQVPERPPEGARGFPQRQGPRPGGDRHRRPRHRCRRHHPCDQFRPAERAGKLRPSYRPHRARRERRHRHLVL